MQPNASPGGPASSSRPRGARVGTRQRRELLVEALEAEVDAEPLRVFDEQRAGLRHVVRCRRLADRRLGAHRDRMHARGMRSTCARRVSRPACRSCRSCNSLPGYADDSSLIRAAAPVCGSRTTSVVCTTVCCRGATLTPLMPRFGERRLLGVGGVLGAPGAERDREALRAAVDHEGVAQPVRLQLVETLAGGGLGRERRDEGPVGHRRVDLLLRDELAEAERIEVGERARAVAVGERSPFEADVGERRGLGRPERRDLLRRQQLDLVRLDLLREAEALAAARAVEERVPEQRQVGEDEEDDDGAHRYVTSKCRARRMRRRAIRAKPEPPRAPARLPARDYPRPRSAG